MNVIKRSGEREDVKLEKITKRIKVQAKGLKNVDPMLIVPKVIAGIRDEITTKELDDLAIKTAANLTTSHSEYDTLAARITISSLHKETSASFSEVMLALHGRKDNYSRARPAVSDDFIKIVKKHKSVLDSAIVYDRDYDFDYLGISTLMKSYLNKLNGKIIERPQQMWMRVAVGIHGKDIEAAVDTYHKMSQKMFTHATPTLFNAGAYKPQLASCFLLHMHDDSIEGIYKTLSDCAKISQQAGGIGVHVHNIRAAGSPIYGTGGTSNGLVPMLRNFNATASYVDQCFIGSTLVKVKSNKCECYMGNKCESRIGSYIWKPIKDIEVSEDLVLTSDGQSHLVVDKKEFDYKGDTIVIKSHFFGCSQVTNNSIQVTPQHIFLVIKNVKDSKTDWGATVFSNRDVIEKIKDNILKIEWVSAEDLTTNDIIVGVEPRDNRIRYEIHGHAIDQVSPYIIPEIDADLLNLNLEDLDLRRVCNLKVEYFEGKVFDLKINDIANYMTVGGIAHNGGGKRKGSFAIYLEPHHADIFEFLDLKRNTGKDEIRARDLFYGLWVPDLFMKRVQNDEEWSLMDPHLSPGLSDVWGETFEKLYTKYENEGKFVRKVKAQELWKRILEIQVETSMPYIMYKDSCNKKSNQQNLGTIKSSNLCTEIVEFTSPDEIAVCNLASVSLPAYVEGKARPKFNHEKLHEIVKTITVNLNRVIDVNHYPLPETKTSNMRHRPIGIGVQGLADTFMKMRICWGSQEAFRLNREIFETIYHAALEASMEEAIEHGAYQTFEGSPASKGLLQYDLWYEDLKTRPPEVVGPLAKTAEEHYCDSNRYDWKALKEKIKKHGLRNSLLLAPMPTASTASILGNTESFEPIPSNIYKRNVLSGEFIVINKYLVEDLVQLGLWNDNMKQAIIAMEGSIQDIPGIPDEIKQLYKTVWEIKQKDLIDLAADRGAFICQSQSLNIYMKEANNKKLTSMHHYGWNKGLKTGSYYIRQTAARQAQKFTVDPAIEKAAKANEIETAKNVLISSGRYTAEDLVNVTKEDLLEMAKAVCSTDNPGDCIMCSS